MPDGRDTKFLQVLSRQIREDRLINVVLAECPLVSFQAKAPRFERSYRRTTRSGSLTVRPYPPEVTTASPLLHHSMGTRLIDLAHSLRRVTFAANLLPPGID